MIIANAVVAVVAIVIIISFSTPNGGDTAGIEITAAGLGRHISHCFCCCYN